MTNVDLCGISLASGHNSNIDCPKILRVLVIPRSQRQEVLMDKPAQLQRARAKKLANVLQDATPAHLGIKQRHQDTPGQQGTAGDPRPAAVVCIRSLGGVEESSWFPGFVELVWWSFPCPAKRPPAFPLVSLPGRGNVSLYYMFGEARSYTFLWVY